MRGVHSFFPIFKALLRCENYSWEPPRLAMKPPRRSLRCIFMNLLKGVSNLWCISTILHSNEQTLPISQHEVASLLNRLYGQSNAALILHLYGLCDLCNNTLKHANKLKSRGACLLFMRRFVSLFVCEGACMRVL